MVLGMRAALALAEGVALRCSMNRDGLVRGANLRSLVSGIDGNENRAKQEYMGGIVRPQQDQD